MLCVCLCVCVGAAAGGGGGGGHDRLRLPRLLTTITRQLEILVTTLTARVKHPAVDVFFQTDEVWSEMVTVLVFMFSKKCQLFLAVYTTTAVLSAYLK